MASNTKNLTIAISGSYNGKAVEKARQDLEKMQTVAAAQMGGVSASLVTAGAAAAEMGGRIHNAGNTLGQIGSAATTGITLPMVAAAAACGRSAIDIDTALTGVRKTVDGTEEQYQGLKDAAIAFSKVNAVDPSQILDIQALGAQLGFNIDELSEFGEVVSGLDIATNMDAETAGTEMAQFANITKLAHGEIRNYASTIVELGNNTATTEADISHMAMRLAASGTQVGMSQAEILGLAATMSSLGIEAEAGGSALSTIMAKIDKGVARGVEGCQAWADAAGMTAEDFAAAWKSDPMGALTTLLAGMDATTQAGGNMSIILEELGVNELRQIDAMKRLAGNSGLIATTVQTANRGWTENIALSKEVENRNSSMSSRLKILKNRVSAAAVEVGEPLVNALIDLLEASQPIIESITGIAESFSAMDEQQQRTILGIAGAVAAFGPLAKVAGTVTKGIGNVVVTGGKLLQGLGRLTSGVTTFGRTATTVGGNAKTAVTGIGTAATTAQGKVKGLGTAAGNARTGIANAGTAAGTAATSMGRMDKAAGLLSTASGVLKGALAGIGIGAVIALVGDIVGKLADWKRHSDLVKDATKSLDQIVGSAKGTFDAGKASAELYGTALSGAALSAGDCLQSQADLNKKVSETYADYRTTAAQVDYYAGVIEDLGTKGSLTAIEQATLGEAVRNFNELTGSSIEVINAQTGELSANVQEVKNLAAAWKDEAEKEALREIYKDYIKQYMQDTLALEDAQRRLNEANEGWGLWIGDFPVIADPASVAYHDLQGEVDDLAKVQQAAYENAQAALRMLGGSTDVFGTVEEALGTLGLSLSDLGTTGEEQLTALSDGFDGSLKSIAVVCAKQGIRIPKALADAIKKSSGLPEEQQDIMLQSLVLALTGYDAETAAYVLGQDIDAGLRDGIAAGRTLPLVPASTLASGVINTLRNRFQTHSPSKVTYAIGLDVGAGLREGIAAGKQDTAESGETLQGALLGAISGLAARFREQGVAAGAQFNAGVDSGKDGAKTAGTALVNSAKTGAASVDLTATGKAAGDRYSAGVKGVNASAAGKAMATTAKTCAAGVDLKPTGKAAGNAYSAGVKGVDASGAGKAVANSAKTGAAGVNAKPAGETLGKSIAEGVKGVNAAGSGQAVGNTVKEGIKSLRAYNEGKTLADDAKNGAASVSAYNTGQNFTRGFIQGFQGVDVDTPIANLAWQTINSLRAHLGVNSPSKEAAYIGEYFGEGLVVGMDRTEKAVAEQARALGDAMLFTPTAFDVPGGASWQGAGGGGGRYNQFNVTVTVNVGGDAATTREQAAGIGRTIGEAMYEEYARRERTINAA